MFTLWLPKLPKPEGLQLIRIRTMQACWWLADTFWHIKPKLL